jgi:epoxyqueuosine reductase
MVSCATIDSRDVLTVSLKQGIQEQAKQLGFSLVGVTTCETLPHAGVFESWLELGRHGEMTYLNTQRSRSCRGHPELLMPECQSVLVLGARYPASPLLMASSGRDELLRGKIASYAWGDDYHEVLHRKLKKVVDFIATQVGHSVPNRWYTDTGPILERELAQRAGLGWIGKNTCLINPGMGSYFFLAEILLGIELEPDPPFIYDRCGTCRRCIDACPTGCILPDRTLDARRCIAYLTIELKGPVPVEMRPLMEGWVFGCDVCQQVCPWNHFASTEVDPTYNTPEIINDPDLLEQMSLQVGSFNQMFRHNPIRRAKRRGYLRNVAVALGNLGSTEAVASLVHALIEDPEPMVRSHAAWALGQIDDATARQALEGAAREETDPQVITEIQSALEN